MKTKTQHTPTPWKLNGYSYVLNEPTRGRIASENGEPVAEEGFELRYENAAFIVRAVNSHEALIEALKYEHAGYEDEVSSWEKHKNDNADCKICKIIAQAEGE